MILVSNDDGIHSEGLRALRDAMASLDEVVVVAPDRERSAVSHSLTLHRPLRAEEIRPGWYAVDGTPTDCVLLAVHRVLGERPRLVVSGINRGANLGDDVHYSGTVSAAKEGTLLDIPSIAVSLVGRRTFRFDAAARFAERLAAFTLDAGLPPNTLLNVNVPQTEDGAVPRRFQITRLGRRRYGDVIVEKTDPRGRAYYWLGGAESELRGEPGTDLAAVAGGSISVTPIHLDLTNYECWERLSSMELPWP
ncbi:MAG: 5'/3'-nucleotidase SurE [Deltaproteobacteria bacterium]|nr:5'/3'-nucleotidase SurE [Deltaproteobacteria bacterium]